MNFSPKLLRKGNLFRIHSEAKKTMNTTNVYVVLLCYKEKAKQVWEN